MNDVSSLYILGAGGHAKAVADVIQGYQLFGNIYFLDDRFPDQAEFECRKMVGTCLDFRRFLSDANAFFVAIGDNTTRRRFFDLMQIDGARLPSVLCSPFISSSAGLGAGTLVMPGAIINADARIGDNVIVNSGAIVEHDCIIGDHSHVAPGSIMTGGAQLGSLVTLGAGAVVCPGISICDGVVLGAGAVVTKDITEPGRYLGAPAKQL
jgi:sugar O-acyltransferase (sialic acid O-acetyltransferase NeuD family)